MHRRPAKAAARFVSALCCAASSIAIENVAIIDVLKGETTEPRTVLIDKGRITAIGCRPCLPTRRGVDTAPRETPEVTIPTDAERVDGRGLYLMPGLVDMHVHFFNNFSKRLPNEWSFPLFLGNGVTAVREMLTEPAALPLAKSWKAPRILAAGSALRASSPAQAREQVREFKNAGADFVKILSEVREPVWRASIEEASRQKIPVCGHVPSEVNLLAAARAGQRSDEHLTQVYEACSSPDGPPGRSEREVLENYDQAKCERVAAELARMGMVQVPTLVLPRNEARRDREKFREDPRWKLLRADEQERWERILQDQTNVDPELAALRWEVSCQIVKTLHAAGVPILAGTDSPMPLVYPGFALHDELELLVQCGMTAAEALRAATTGPAEFLGRSQDYGFIAVDKHADLVLLEANPLEQISNIRRIRAVTADGHLYPRKELDRFLGAAVD